MTIGSLFSGIGGLELGLERAGLGPVLWQVERDPFCREVLHKHWPEAIQYNDVSTVGKADLVSVDVLCGGFPCQPFSLAGKRKGEADERHLWPQFARIIGEIRPRFIVAENVLGLRTAGLPGVLADLAALGYDAEWHCASAVELGAPHIRRRIFILAADANRVELRDEPWGLAGAFAAAFAPVPGHIVEGGDASHADSLRRLEQARRVANERGWPRLVGWELADVAGMDDGFPVRLGAARKAYGNAVVPQCAEVVGRVIMQMQKEAA